ncbi:MAG: glycoside hydrolase [Planctomycetaceae bacterium]|nr:glycoside hydrolase [Planctomycetaceae bacterium]
MKHLSFFSVLCFVFCLIFLATFVYAQQDPDVNAWQKQYEKRVKDTLERRTKEKPNFPIDVQFSKPDYIVFIPAVEADKLGDTYNDHFQVFNKSDGTLFATWCQATCEGALDQHIAFTKSKDGGKTWTPVSVIAGNRTIAEGLANGGRIASWGFTLTGKSGRIYLIYNQFIPGKVSTNRQHTGIMVGIYSDDDGETWSKPVEIPVPRTSNDGTDPNIPVEWVVWQRPTRLGKNGNYLVGVSRYVHPSLHNKYRTITEFIHFDNIDDNPEVKDLKLRWVMTGDKALHKGVHCEEPCLVKLPDGRLFCIMRSGTGSPLWTISSDFGETWTEPKTLLMKDGGDPIAHPMSPCPIYDWKGNEAGSGTYFFLAHNKFDKANPNPWQNRGTLYLFAGRYQKDAEQPVWFDGPKTFIERKSNNSFYTSLTIEDGKTVLWYPDQKFYLLGKVIDEKYFDGKADAEVFKPE